MAILAEMDSLFLHSHPLSTFFIMFFSVYLAAYLIVFRNWGSNHRKEATSCFMSLFHGSPAVIMAIHALLNSKNSRDFASANSALHDRVLEFSMAYFLMDLLHYLVFVPHDVLFILHHLATLYVLATCRYVVHHGAYGILLLLILAEITSPVQNTWSIARFRKVDVPAAAKLYEFLSPRFYVFYSVVRGVLGPICVFKMVVFFVSGAASALLHLMYATVTQQMDGSHLSGGFSNLAADPVIQGAYQLRQVYDTDFALAVVCNTILSRIKDFLQFQLSL
ncbi:hypothetical protein Tsubulata_016861 [Turnera subulata]|uniref:TLC domain-containing protein n=1 Tax=Turnera subulata TaxID=218843 RepID=A0A9Q0FZX3_9ROSI|nr:hypothetical protein Tsubulata_016861 [Turnera subulata]